MAKTSLRLSEDEVKDQLFVIRSRYPNKVFTKYGVYLAVLILDGRCIEDNKAWAVLKKMDSGEIMDPEWVCDMAKKFGIAITRDKTNKFAVTATDAIELVLLDES